MDSFRTLIAAAAAAAALVSACGAQAQAPAPVPRKDPHYGPPITLEQAKAASAAAAAEARKRGLESTIAVCDPSGELVYFEKANESQYAAGELAIGKCRAAARYRRSSKEISDTLKAGNLATLSLPGAVMGDAGGIPILVHGLIIGAIGSTGGEGEVVSRAGADAVK
jgi:uncharacterized protein GlcG (DUF336 family)